MKCIVQDCENEARRASNYCQSCWERLALNLGIGRHRRPMPNAVIAGVIIGVIGIVILVDLIKKF